MKRIVEDAIGSIHKIEGIKETHKASMISLFNMFNKLVSYSSIGAEGLLQLRYNLYNDIGFSVEQKTYIEALPGKLKRTKDMGDISDQQIKFTFYTYLLIDSMNNISKIASQQKICNIVFMKLTTALKGSCFTNDDIINTHKYPYKQLSLLDFVPNIDDVLIYYTQLRKKFGLYDFISFNCGVDIMREFEYAIQQLKSMCMNEMGRKEEAAQKAKEIQARKDAEEANRLEKELKKAEKLKKQQEDEQKKAEEQEKQLAA
jgi:hypothetical protein